MAESKAALTIDGKNYEYDVRPGTVDLGVDETLQVRGALVAQRVAVLVEAKNIGARHQRRRHAAREEEPVAAREIARTDVAEPVDHPLVEQDVVRVDQLVDQRGRGGHGPPTECR